MVIYIDQEFPTCDLCGKTLSLDKVVPEDQEVVFKLKKPEIAFCSDRCRQLYETRAGHLSEIGGREDSQ